MFKRIIVAATFVVTSFTSASALDYTKSIEIAAAPKTVWKAIGEFCGIEDWHPAVEKCALSEKDGKTLRTLTLKDGGTIVERLEARDDEAMSYTYTILEGVLPVANYRSTIRVVKSGRGSKVTWTCNFRSKGAPNDRASKAISGVYEAGLRGISGKVERGL
ncbi:MAG: SRPBCC family protein [Methylobacterium organophilum]|nr:SRPBCC family protein [Methylobacterium organophilum]